MKFTINRERILERAEDMLVAVPSRIVTTATSGILIEVDADGRIQMCTTDLNFIMKSRSTVDAVDGRLSVVLPAQRFVNALKYMTGETVEVTAQGWTHNVQITDGVSDIRLSVIADAFPDVSYGDDVRRVCAVDGVWLRNAITQLEFAAEHNEKLDTVMNCMLIDYRDGKVAVVSGKGSIICRRTQDVLEQFLDDHTSFVIPRSTIRVLRTVLKDAERCVLAGNAEGTRLVVSTDDHSASVPLRAAAYPNYVAMYDRVSDCTTKETLLQADLRSALLRATVVLPGQPNETAPISLSMHETRIDLSLSSGAGTFQEAVTSQKEGQPLDIMFDLRRLSDGVAIMPGPDVVLQGSTRSSPMWLSSGDTEIIIMPQVRAKT